METDEQRKALQDIDAVLHSGIGRFTHGLSPTALSTAAIDWGMHLIGSPSRQAQLWRKALANTVRAFQLPDAADAEDRRFASADWDKLPFALYRHWFVLAEEWWQTATAPIDGIDPSNQRTVAFMTRQALDMACPTNTMLTNPTVLRATAETGGQNLTRGLRNWIEDLNHLLRQQPPKHPDYRVGETIAVTPGDVVFRNELIELIRYRPTTKTVYAEPILIVPAWIMKYYILDLSPENSFVAWLRDQGYEVYILSWKNPHAEDSALGLQDYVDLGVRAALDHIAPNPTDRIHAVGYCLGGTLLAAAAAAMARDDDARLKSLSLLAAQVDFTEPGELSLFINESQVTFLEHIMSVQGYLRADQMAGAFRMLRSGDLIWSRVIRHYLLGERTPMNDLMAWNADATRMPARMHSEYLRQLFLENRLAKGRFRLDGKHVALTDIKTPIFTLATETDHVSPWQSVYKIKLLTDTDVTFCLTKGGHNSGVLSEPGHARRHYRIGLKSEGRPYVSPEDWIEKTGEQDGSWWPEFDSSLASLSTGRRKTGAAPKQVIGTAPGEYVHD